MKTRESIFAWTVVVVTIILFYLVFVLPVRAQSLAVTQQKTITITTQSALTIKTTSTAPNIRDYVGLYTAGSITYFDWFYVASGTKIRAAQGSKSTVKFITLKPGKYEAKLYALTDAGVTTLRDTFAFTVAPKLTGVETEGSALTVTRRATNEPDKLDFVVDGATGTLLAPRDTAVTVKP